MPYYINFPNKCAKWLESPIHKPLDTNNLQSLKIVYDTEFTLTDKMIVDSVQLYLPELDPHNCLVFLYDELNEQFNPLSSSLNWYSINGKIATETELEPIFYLQELFDKLVHGLNKSEIKNTFKYAIEEGYFNDILDPFNLNSTQLSYSKNRYTKELEIEVKLPKIYIELEGFFNDVDLFKIWGKLFQQYLLNARLESRRVIKTNSIRSDIKLGDAYWINNKLFEVYFNLRDTMNRFPVLSGKGLDNQCKVYKARSSKISIDTDEIKAKLNLDYRDTVKSNMSLLRELDPLLFVLYGGVDVYANHNLSVKSQELLDTIRGDFNLDNVPIKDTTGSNVCNFIQDLYQKHFNPTNNEKIAKLITHQKRLGNADNLQNITLNHYGIQSLRTVGGLLYSRCQRYPYIKGILGDLDMSSCYATMLCSMNIYLGQPILSCFKGKSKPTLREVLETIESVNAPNDGWLVRVSGSFEKVVNTLLLSDLDFKPKKEQFKTVWDVNPSRLSINHFNAYKVGKQEANSTILTKECKFSIINSDLLECIKLLPDSWVDEYLDLSVDSLVFIPSELICNSIEEYEEKLDNYPDTDEVPTYDKKTGLTGLLRQYSKNNLCLRMPIHQYYKELKAKRKVYKDAKNPIQEVYKLFLNSGYGALACRYLPVNNLLAANQITASPRATGWLMINALNGFQVITDGCTFNWEVIPLGLRFKDILEENPNYLIDYNPNINSGITINNNTAQLWIDNNFRQHLLDFYQINNSCTPITRFDFELKDETFTSSRGDAVTTVIYSDFVNTGSGNYSKGLDGNQILIDATEYDFSDNWRKVKARSFKGKDENLLRWYVDCLTHSYREPLIYSENQIIKFGEGCEIAKRLLQLIDEIAFPCGFSKTNYKLMKLVTRSQFLFKSEKQLRNFETNQKKLDELSRYIMTRKFWETIPDNLDKLEPYGITELSLSWEDYYNFAKEKPIGLGFELLALNQTHKGSIESVRQFISDKIDENKINLGKFLNIDKYLTLGKQFLWLFVAMIILKANSDNLLKTQLKNSVNEPTIMTVTREQLITLGELFGQGSFDD
jgi:hypothetical protein